MESANRFESMSIYFLKKLLPLRFLYIEVACCIALSVQLSQPVPADTHNRSGQRPFLRLLSATS